MCPVHQHRIILQNTGLQRRLCSAKLKEIFMWRAFEPWATAVVRLPIPLLLLNNSTPFGVVK
jgi:hypothetical protein